MGIGIALVDTDRPLAGHQTPPDVCERFHIWRCSPARLCRWLGCEAETEYVLVFVPSRSCDAAPQPRHLPICPECARDGLGIDVLAMATPAPNRPPQEA